MAVKFQWKSTIAMGCWLSAEMACNTAQAVDWNAHYQATYIKQHKNAFDAAYSGPNSLSTHSEDSYSFTATAFWGLGLWPNGELYFNPEVARGVALSNLTGLGGYVNGEMARTSGPSFNLYRARLFLRQSWNLAGTTSDLEDGPNQLPMNLSDHRFVFTLGNLSLADVFDNNSYSHDGRTQFFNWALVSYGAYDFAADARGYTWAAVGELYQGDWVLRFGRGLLPKEPNGMSLDTRFFKHYGDQLEVQRSYSLAGQAGSVRLLGYHDRAVMARYRDALAFAAQNNSVPDINMVRNIEQDKYGIGIAVEQTLTDGIGIFLRAMHADGKTETEAYATVDRSLAVGIGAHGRAWERGDDTLGAALAWNELSRDNRRYLEAGGLDFFIGDGRLRYGPEQIIEAYYDLQVFPGLRIAADLQHVAHPAYNRDRGPATVSAVRVHADF